MGKTLLMIGIMLCLFSLVWTVSPSVPGLSGWLFGVVLGLFGGIPAFLAVGRKS